MFLGDAILVHLWVEHVVESMSNDVSSTEQAFVHRSRGYPPDVSFNDDLSFIPADRRWETLSL